MSEFRTSNTDGTGDSVTPESTEAAVRVAEENNIDLSTVEGTGQGGRITVDDVNDVVAQQNAPDPVSLEQAQAEWGSAMGYLGFAQAANDPELIRQGREQLADKERQLDEAREREQG